LPWSQEVLYWILGAAALPLVHLPLSLASYCKWIPF
jgi:hypothetical protein